MNESNERKKEFLNGYRESLLKQRRIENDIEEYRLSKISPSVIYDDMPHGTDQRDLSDYIVILESKIAKYNKARLEQIQRRDDIRRAIEELVNEDERTILYMRYIKLDDKCRNTRWEQICIDSGYEWAQCHRIHARALKNLEI